MDATPSCDRHEERVAYLYGECETEERERFEAHLASCKTCAAEIDALRSVRRSLEAWAPPEAALGFRIVSDPPRREVRWWRPPRWSPAWGLAAGALCVAVALALVGLEFRWEGDGFVIRMGRPGTDATVASAAPEGTGRPETGDDALLQRIQALIEQSERRQQQEFAARLLSLAQDFDLQRREDQIRVQQEVGDLAEYLVRVSGR